MTIDLDPTDDQTHGQQRLTFFSAHYDSWCYLRLLGFASFNDEPQPFLVAAILRSGTATPKVGAIGLLNQLSPALREAFPFAVI